MRVVDQWVCALGVLVLGGSSGCDSGDLSSDDASSAFLLASTQMVSAAQSGDETAKADSLGWSVNYACTGGGTITATGTYDGAQSVAQYDLSAQYNSCKFGGTTMVGSLHYALDYSSTGTYEYTVTSSFDGDLTFSGTYDGSCSIDVTLSVATTATSAKGTYSGSVCGYNASSTLSYSSSN